MPNLQAKESLADFIMPAFSSAKEVSLCIEEEDCMLTAILRALSKATEVRETRRCLFIGEG